MSDPLVVQTYPDYAAYLWLAAEADEPTLLDVPVGVRSGLDSIGSGGEVLQYYQHIHGKPLINGMVARLPRSVFAFYRTHPSLLLLSGEVTPVAPAELDRDFASVLRWSGAGYVFGHHSLLTGEQARRIVSFLERQPQLTPLGVEGDLRMYRVSQ